MRTIRVISTSRADEGIYESVLDALNRARGVKCVLSRLALDIHDDSPAGIARKMAEATRTFADSFAADRPDIIVVLGDRYEMHAAAVAAQPFLIPVAHIHGGERTGGLIDENLRHSITKLSHLHFVSHPDYARRVMQMGEEPWRVHVVGAPSLDGIRTMQSSGPGRRNAPILVTFHPVTLEYDRAGAQMGEILAALPSGRPVIFTAPNADTRGSDVRKRILAYVARTGAKLVENAGRDLYFLMMSNAAVMVGNSSSGIIEAPSFRLPVVNVGSRQDGRVKAANVIDCPPRRAAIRAAIRKALSPGFCKGIAGMANPYWHGGAAEKIAQVLRDVPLGDGLIRKGFVD